MSKMETKQTLNHTHLLKKTHNMFTFKLKMQCKKLTKINQNYIITYIKVIKLWEHFLTFQIACIIF